MVIGVSPYESWYEDTQIYSCFKMNNINHLFTNRECYGSDPTGDVQRVAEAGSITQAAAKVHRVPSNSLPVYASWKQNWG